MSEKILLINPEENIPRKTEMYPSGALLLIGSLLIEKGYKVSIIHMTADRLNIEGVKTKVRTFNPEIVGITMNTFQTRSAREVSKAIKSINKNITVVSGGPHPSALKLSIFRDFSDIDIVVYGEGEHTFLEIVEGKNLKNISGVCYENKINEPRPSAQNLDYIPLPNLDLVGGINGLKRFVGANPVGARPSMYIMASRGCPFHCTFCNKSIWGSKARFRKPASIIEEIKWLHEKYQVREIFFQDDTLNLNRKWIKEIFDLIIDNDLNKNIVYKIVFKADENLVDKELLQLAKEAGVWLIFYGVESGNQKMLNRMKKGLTTQEIMRAFELTHKVGLKTVASFIIGLSGEDKKTIKDTFNLWKELNPYEAGYSFAIPFPDTEFERTVRKKGHLLVTDYDTYAPDVCVVRTDALSKKDLEYYRVAIINDIALSKYTLKNLTSRLMNLRCLKAIMTDSFQSPKSMMKRLERLCKAFLMHRRERGEHNRGKTA